MILRIRQLDKGWVPSVTSGRTSGYLGFDGSIMSHGIDPDGPVVALSLVLVGLAGMLQPHLDDGLGLAPVLVDDLAEPDVAPGVAIGMVEGGDGGHLAGLVRVPAPANGRAGPSVSASHLVDHDGSPDDGVGSKQWKIGVIVNLSDGLLPVQYSIFPTKVSHLVLIRSTCDTNEAGAVHLPRVEVSSNSVSSAGKLQHGLDRDQMDVVGVGVASHTLEVNQRMCH